MQEALEAGSIAAIARNIAYVLSTTEKYGTPEVTEKGAYKYSNE